MSGNRSPLCSHPLLDCRNTCAAPDPDVIGGPWTGVTMADGYSTGRPTRRHRGLFTDAAPVRYGRPSPPRVRTGPQGVGVVTAHNTGPRGRREYRPIQPDGWLRAIAVRPGVVDSRHGPGRVYSPDQPDALGAFTATVESGEVTSVTPLDGDT